MEPSEGSDRVNLFVCVLLSLVSLFVVVVTRPALFTTTLLCQHVQVTCCCHYYVTYNVDKLTYIFVSQDSLNPCGCFRLLGSAYTDCINQQAELHTTHTHTGVSNPPQPRAPPRPPPIYLSISSAGPTPTQPPNPSLYLLCVTTSTCPSCIIGPNFISSHRE